MKKSDASFYADGLTPGREFSAVYMDMRNLRSLMQKKPEYADNKIVHAVWDVIMEQRYSSQRMSQLLYRECSKALAAIGYGCPDCDVSHSALQLQVQAASSCKKICINRGFRRAWCAAL